MNKNEETFDYLENHNVYRSNGIGINIRALFKYAEQKGKEIKDLSKEEVRMFETRKRAVG